jgi:hypothetical protein
VEGDDVRVGLDGIEDADAWCIVRRNERTSDRDIEGITPGSAARRP